MDNANKLNLQELIKKPAVMIGGAVVIVVVLLMLIFGRGGAVSDPKATELKNLSNRHGSTIKIIDKYAKEARSANLRSNLAQANIILTANKSEIDEYYKEAFSKLKDVKATFKEEPRESLTVKLEEGIVSNNLDKVLQSAVIGELEDIGSAMQSVKKNNPEKKKLDALMDKLNINIQTIIDRVNEPL